MLEILAIIVLGNRAASRGHSRWYGVYGPALGWSLGFVSLLLWGALDAAGVTIRLPIPVFGYLAGYVASWFVVGRLERKDGFGSTAAPSCPSCGSQQTEAMGDMVQCYACDRVSMVSAKAA